MIWADGGWFANCEQEWVVSQCYKVRAKYGEHERYGPQIEIVQIRAATDADRDDGFDPVEFVERSRFDASAMFDELRKLVEGEVADEPLRRLVLLLLDRHAEALKRLPGSPGTTTRSPAAGWSTPWR